MFKERNNIFYYIGSNVTIQVKVSTIFVKTKEVSKTAESVSYY